MNLKIRATLTIYFTIAACWILTLDSSFWALIKLYFLGLTFIVPADFILDLREQNDLREIPLDSQNFFWVNPDVDCSWNIDRHCSSVTIKIFLVIEIST